jgi:4-hydroxy-tetrahydrodipicolinate synthase
MSKPFTGVIPILATPFTDDERLDLDAWERMLEFMVALKVDGVTIIGVLGESSRLNDHEREQLISNAVKIVNKRVPIIVGSSFSGSAAAAHLSKRAQDLGADALMVTPAKEPVPNDERIFEYYQRIAQSVSIPIVLQDHPASTEVHMSVALMLKIAREIPSIACVKEEAVPTAPKIRQIIDGLRDRPVPVLSGLGALYAPFDLQAGSSGFNTGFAFPEVLRAMVDAANANDWPRVHAVYARFAALIVFEQQPGVAIRKEILRRRGLLNSSRARHPGASITPLAMKQLDALLEQTLPGADLTKALSV